MAIRTVITASQVTTNVNIQKRGLESSLSMGEPPSTR
jgi:hypothetical protein